MELVEIAEELGIDVDGRWGDERLQEEINKALALQDKELTEEEGDLEEDELYEFAFTGTSRSFHAGSAQFVGGEPLALTAEQLKEPKVKHAINLGLIKAV